MQVNIPADVEDVVREFLSKFLDVDVIAYPLPMDIPNECVCVQKLGGSRTDIVCDESLVSIDCRAENEIDALALARTACALMSMASGQGDIHAASLNSTPYLNPDPHRPELFRYSFAAQVVCRAQTKEIN